MSRGCAKHTARFEWGKDNSDTVYGIQIVFASDEDYENHLKDRFSSLYEGLKDEGYEKLDDADWWAVIEYRKDSSELDGDSLFIPGDWLC